MPNCTSDGRFNPIQCHNASCWCVDEKGLEIAESRVRDVLPDCAGKKYSSHNSWAVKPNWQLFW